MTLNNIENQNQGHIEKKEVTSSQRRNEGRTLLRRPKYQVTVIEKIEKVEIQ